MAGIITVCAFTLYIIKIVQRSNNRLNSSISHFIKNPIRRTNKHLQEFLNFSLEINLFYIE